MAEETPSEIRLVVSVAFENSRGETAEGFRIWTTANTKQQSLHRLLSGSCDLPLQPRRFVITETLGIHVNTELV